MTWYEDRASLRRRLAAGFTGGLLGMVLVPLAVVFLNSLSLLEAGPLIVRQTVLTAAGWPWQGLLVLELALAFAFGAAVGLAVPPMEGGGRGAAVRTAVHLAVSTGLYAGLCAVCGLWTQAWSGRLVILSLYWFAYALVWLLRYLAWRAELEKMRQMLGLAPAAGGKAFWPYPLLAALTELALPFLLRLADPPDVPVLTGLLYPFLLLPFFCLATGWSIGRRWDWRWLPYALLCGVLTLPGVFLLYNATALFQAGAAAGAAILGGALASLRKVLRAQNTEKRQSGRKSGE